MPVSDAILSCETIIGKIFQPGNTTTHYGGIIMTTYVGPAKIMLCNPNVIRRMVNSYLDGYPDQERFYVRTHGNTLSISYRALFPESKEKTEDEK